MAQVNDVFQLKSKNKIQLKASLRKKAHDRVDSSFEAIKRPDFDVVSDISVNDKPKPKRNNFDDILNQYFDPLALSYTKRDQPIKSNATTPKGRSTPKTLMNELKTQFGFPNDRLKVRNKSKENEKLKTPGNRFHEELKNIT